MIIYGISTCDTTKAAIKALQRAGKDVTFRDIRANPLTEAEIAYFDYSARHYVKLAQSYQTK